MDDVAAAIARHTRVVADFPEPGIAFSDLTPVLADAETFGLVVDGLAESACTAAPDLVAGLDARGFLLAAAVAVRLGTGVLAVRKAGKLPPPVHSRSYRLEYGHATLEVPAEGIALAGRRVLVVDDVLATGGTLGAAAALLGDCAADVVGIGVVLELTALGGRDKLPGIPLTALSTD